jgi:copper chaperone CopZ
MLLAVASTIGMAPQAEKKKRVTFTVYGECGMCEERIESALNSLKGVAWADWELATLELTVKYDPAKITLLEIKQKVAEIGHDTDEVHATQEAYEELHACCKYERPKN